MEFPLCHPELSFADLIACKDWGHSRDEDSVSVNDSVSLSSSHPGGLLPGGFHSSSQESEHADVLHTIICSVSEGPSTTTFVFVF